MNREERIRIYGSPIFPFEPTILANKSWHFSPEGNSKYAKYLPFDSFVIHNDSASTIKVEYRDNIMFIYAGQSREEKNLAFNILKITELSGVDIGAGKLKVEIKRSPMDADKKAIQDTIDMATGLRKMFSMGSGL